MLRDAISLRSVTVAAISAALLSWSAIAVAQPQQPSYGTRAPAITYKKRKPLQHPSFSENQSPRRLYGCAWPYRNMEPPCQSTWPPDDPNYHGGAHPGVHGEYLPN
jgi:hypothetical protein